MTRSCVGKKAEPLRDMVCWLDHGCDPPSLSLDAFIALQDSDPRCDGDCVRWRALPSGAMVLPAVRAVSQGGDRLGTKREALVEARKITSKGQVTIPKRFRDRFGLRAGEAVCFRENDEGELVLERQTASLDDLIGLLGPAPDGRTVSVEAMDDAVAAAVAEDHERIVSE
jgi:AbrB family looped-hinge helix DNA binding protein